MGPIQSSSGCGKDKLRRMFQADLEKDVMGVGVHRIGSEIHFAYPILITVG